MGVSRPPSELYTKSMTFALESVKELPILISEGFQDILITVYEKNVPQKQKRVPIRHFLDDEVFSDYLKSLFNFPSFLLRPTSHHDFPVLRFPHLFHLDPAVLCVHCLPHSLQDIVTCFLVLC